MSTAIYGLLGIYCIAVAIMFVRSPRTGVLSLLVLVAFSLNALPWEIFHLGVDQVGAKLQAAIMMAAICYPFVTGNVQVIKHLISPYHLFCICFFIMMGFYLPLGGYLPYGMEKFVLFGFKCVVPIMALFLLSPLSRIDMYTIAGTFVVSALLMALTSLEFSSVVDERSSLGGTLGPITIGRILAAGIFVTIFLLGEKGLWNRLLTPATVMTLLFLVYAFIGTGSRGPLMSVAISLILVLLINGRSHARQKATLAVLIVFGVFLLLTVFQATDIGDSIGLRRLTYLLEDRELGESELVRLNLQGYALQAFAESSGLGVGTGGFAGYIHTDREWPHNLILEILAELGIPGILLFSGMFYLTGLRWFRRMRSTLTQGPIEICLQSLWIFYFLNSLVSHDISANFGFWISAAFPWLPETSQGTKAGHSNREDSVFGI